MSNKNDYNLHEGKDEASANEKPSCKAEPASANISRSKRFFEKSGKYVSADFVAEYFNVSRRTVEGWTYRGLIPSIKINGKLVRYDLEKIEQWIASQNAKE